MEKREHFSSRLGFILISAGCAIGLGNVWRFPYNTGKYGGAALCIDLPCIPCHSRASDHGHGIFRGTCQQKSAARSFHVLEPSGTKWHITGYLAMAGNYLLMMFYTTVGGWMLYYVYKMICGEFVGTTPEEVGGIFNGMLSDPVAMTLWMLITVLICFGICSLGLQKGVERITKVMMSFLLIILIILCIRSVTLDGAAEGIRFYLIPDFGKILENGLGEVILPPWVRLSLH